MATVRVFNAGATFLLLGRGPQKYGFMKNVIKWPFQDPDFLTLGLSRRLIEDLTDAYGF
jgi:hypothetical protein